MVKIEKMGKNRVFEQKKLNRRVKVALFLISMILIITLFSLNFISAFNFDNVKSYNSNTKEYTITNAFGLGSEIAKVKLNTPIVYNVIRGKDRLVAEFEIDLKENIGDVFNSMKFYDLKKGNIVISRTFTYKYKTYENYEIEIPDEIKEICIENKSSGKQDCNNEIISYKKEIRQREIWNDLDTTKTFPIGKITIGIFTDVYANDYVEWIPTILGQNLNDWAIWSDSLNVELKGVWTFNNNNESIYGVMNLYNYSTGSQISFSTWNINGKAGQFNNSAFMNISNSGTNLDWNFNGSGGTTLAFWFNSSSDNSVLIQKKTASGGWYIAKYPAGGSCRVNGLTTADIDVSCPANKSVFLVVRKNDTSISIFVNGTMWKNSLTNPLINLSNDVVLGNGGSVGLGNTVGYIDEIYLWNRSLTDAEILSLYNNGNGIFYNTSSLSLLYPNNYAEYIKNSNINFNCSVNGTNYIKNVSLWTNITGSWVIYNTYVVASDTNNLISNWLIPIGSTNWKWSCSACDNNSICDFALENRTIITKTYINNSQVYNLTTIERSIENFVYNITIGSGTLNSAYIWYNNTLYPSTITNPTLTNYIISNSLTTPSLSTSANISFWWVFNFNSGQENTTSLNQSVLAITLDDCSVNTRQIFNLTLRDEQYQDILNGTVYNTSIEIDINLYQSSIINSTVIFSKVYNITNPVRVCIDKDIGNSQIYMDATIKFMSDDRVEEFFYYQKYPFTNSTNIIKNLYDLLLVDSTTFITTFTDENGVLQKNVIISLLRKYVGEGIFKEVENGKTNNDGETTLHLVQEDVIYKFNVTKDNVVLYISDEYTVYCVSGTLCTISLSAFSGVGDFPNIPKNYYNIVSNRTSRYITLTFNMNSSALMNMSVYRYENNKSDATIVIGKNSTIGSYGILTVYVPYSYGNSTYLVKVYKENVLVGNHIVNMRENPSDYFGNWVLFLVAISIIALGLMAVSSGEGMIIFAIIGLIGAVITNIMIMPYSILIYIVVAGLIIIIKLRTGERG
jgi:hypothetical protein